MLLFVSWADTGGVSELSPDLGPTDGAVTIPAACHEAGVLFANAGALNNALDRVGVTELTLGRQPAVDAVDVTTVAVDKAVLARQPEAGLEVPELAGQPGVLGVAIDTEGTKA